MSDISELSDSDSDKEDARGETVYGNSRHPQGDGIATEGIQNLLTRADKRKARNKKASKQNKKQKRINSRSTSQPQEDPQLVNRHLLNAQPVASSYASENFNISGRGYIGKRDPGDERTYWLHEMVGEDSKFKFRLRKWDGRQVQITYPAE